MASENYILSIILRAQDAASGALGKVQQQLRGIGTEGKRSLKSMEDLRSQFRQGLTFGGIGVAGLLALTKGIKAAGDFESVMSDLRLTFSEGGKDVAKIADQLNRVEQLTVKLGNALPGNTADFVQMVTVLRQGGLEAETILNGAGEAVANLAVVTKQVPRDLAKDFAQFGQQFKLKPEEFTKAADLFSRIYSRSGLGSSELIEGSKYFQLRAGAPLGLKGIEGAETGARLMAAMKKLGLEGSVAGTGTATFFKEIADPKKLAKLRKETGVDLQFFDQKGGFLGIDNAFKQMEKLRALSTQMRITSLDKLVGSEGAAVGSSISEMGLSGWKQFNAELDKSASLEDAIKTKTADFNAKMEALSGTIDNIKVAVFGPMLDTLKPLVDLANAAASEFQEFAKAHPVLAKIVTQLVGLASVGLTVVGAVKGMTAAYGLWRTVTTVGSSEAALLGFLGRLRGEAVATGIAMRQPAGFIRTLPTTQAAPAARSAGSMLGRIFGSAFAVGLPLYIAYELVKAEEAEAAAAAKQAGDRLGELFRQHFEDRLKGLGKEEIEKLDKERAPEVAKNVVAEFGLGQSRSTSFTKQSEMVNLLHKAAPEDTDDPNIDTAESQAEAFKKISAKLYASGISTAAELKEFLRQADEALTSIGSPELVGILRQAAEDAFPQLIAQIKEQSDAQEKLAHISNFAIQSILKLSYSIDVLGGKRPLFNLNPPFSADNPPKSKFGFTLDNSERQNPLVRRDFFGRPIPVTKQASGGSVQGDGMVYVHAGEDIVPARVTARYKEKGGGVTITGGVSFTINPPAGSAMANDPKVFAEEAMKHITRRVRRQRELR